MAVAIQTIPNYIRDLIRILNKFSIKIYLYLDGHGAKRRLAMTIQPYNKARCSGVVAWMVKNALGVIPAKAGIQKILKISKII
ncbi:hypothetical protein [Rickettsia endosymbiont of Orchestes rusci]|uniref:hypothetical protein n=1 Tax=Rickettsia endosymbiont of Orchestes rusci TaxID=3066250 RepID=UPI00313BEFD9